MSVLKSILRASHREGEVDVSPSATGELGGEREWDTSSQETSGNVKGAEIGLGFFLSTEMCYSNSLSIAKLSFMTCVSWARCEPSFRSSLFGIKKLKPS